MPLKRKRKRSWAATKRALRNQTSGAHFDAALAHDAEAKAWRKKIGALAGEPKSTAEAIWALHVGMASRHEKAKKLLEPWEEDDMRHERPRLPQFDDVAVLWKDAGED